MDFIRIAIAWERCTTCTWPWVARKPIDSPRTIHGSADRERKWPSVCRVPCTRSRVGARPCVGVRTALFVPSHAFSHFRLNCPRRPESPCGETERPCSRRSVGRWTRWNFRERERQSRLKIGKSCRRDFDDSWRREKETRGRRTGPPWYPRFSACWKFAFSFTRSSSSKL